MTAAKNDSAVSQNEWIRFNATWTSQTGLAGYIFSINQTGQWINSSYTLFNGNANVSVNITQITATVGTNVTWRFFANDSLGQWNVTDTQNFTVEGGGASFGTLNMVLYSPTGSNNQPVNQSFRVLANVSCVGAPSDSCGIVSGRVRYNASDSVPNVDVTGGGVFADPFYTFESNPMSCGAMTGASSICNLSWAVNATGRLNSKWVMDVNFSSDNANVAGTTNGSFNITIIDSTLSITISSWLQQVDFNTGLNPGSQNNSALNNTHGVYNVTCQYMGGNCNVSIKGNDDLFSNGNRLGVTNVSWNRINDLNTKRSLTFDWGVINATLSNLAQQLIFFWLDVPSGAIAGTYASNFTIQGQAN